MKYKVLIGLNYPTKQGEKRAEIGDIVDDLPEKSVPWLLRQGCIEECKRCNKGAVTSEGGDD